MADEDILDAIEQNLAQPRRARTDAGEVEQHDLAQQVDAAKFVMEQRAVAVSPFKRLAFARLEMPGASN